MKQIILFISLIISITTTYSQDKKINFQISLGSTLSLPKTSELTTTKINGSPEIKSSLNIGTYILPSINYSLNDNSSLDFGIGFYLDRFSIEDKIGPITDKGNRSINQIQTPLNFNFHFGRDKSYLFGIGGFINFLISSKEKGKRETRSIQNQFSVNDLDFINNSSITYNKNIKNRYNKFSLGTFIQLRKNIIFLSDKKGFIVLKINQYLNSIKKENNDSNFNQLIQFKKEKESTTVNIGIGLTI